MTSPAHRNRRRAGALGVMLATLAGRPAFAVTYVSAEPIPSPAIVGSASLAKIEGIGFARMDLWGRRLLNDCHIVDDTVAALSADHAIDAVTPDNAHVRVAAGGFQGVTDPSYVFKVRDRGAGAASAADIYVLDNALGYVLNQGGTSQFTLPYNPANPYEFALGYAVVTVAGALPGERAKAFFDHLGTIDPALWSGANAGFTQIRLNDAPLNDSLLFLIGGVPVPEFTTGLLEAARTTPGATYAPLSKAGRPTTATAGAAFLGNGWTTPSGGYLENIPASPRLSRELARLRRRHLEAVVNLLGAIDAGEVGPYLGQDFACPVDAEP